MMIIIIKEIIKTLQKKNIYSTSLEKKTIKSPLNIINPIQAKNKNKNKNIRV